jgi:ferredoxin
MAVATDISYELEDSKLIAIPSVINEKIKANSPTIGLVFPVYMWGMPHMVMEFVDQLRLAEDQYVFAVTTCAGMPGESLLQLKNMLIEKGSDLHAGYAVKEAANTMQKDNFFIKLARLIEPNERIKLSGKERLKEIVETIKNKEITQPEKSSRLLNIYGKFIYKGAMSRINTMGKFWVDEECNLCLNCQKICPSNNIQIVDDKPVWNQKCEFCQACIQWCPKKAIHIKNEDLNRHYHHPQIKIKDLFLR